MEYLAVYFTAYHGSFTSRCGECVFQGTLGYLGKASATDYRSVVADAVSASGKPFSRAIRGERQITMASANDDGNVKLLLGERVHVHLG